MGSRSCLVAPLLLVQVGLAAALLAPGCTLLADRIACDEQTPCPAGARCGADGFCARGAAADAGAALEDAGAGLLQTTTTLVREPDSVELGQIVTLEIRVVAANGGAPVAGGDVHVEQSIDDGATWAALATTSLDEDGAATLFDAPQLHGTVHRARFEGTARHAPSTSSPTPPVAVTLPADVAPTETSVVGAPALARLGDDVVLEVRVRAPDQAGAPVDRGAVVLQVLAASGTWENAASADLDQDGAVSLAHRPEAAGTLRYRAWYGGEVGLAPSMSPPTGDVIVSAPTATTLVRSPAAVEVGAPIALVASVRAPDEAGAPVTSGSVALQRTTDGTVWTDVETRALDATGRVSTSFVPDQAGTLYFRAVYEGDGSFERSTSSPTPPTDVLASTFTALQRDPDVVQSGGAVTLSAQVATPGPSGSPVTTGEVAFDASTDDGASWQLLARVPLDGAGAATLTDHPSIDGVVHRARFLGAGGLAPSTSLPTAPVAVTLDPDAVATETTLARDPSSVDLGGTVQLLAVVTSGGGAAPVAGGTVTVQLSSDGAPWEDVATGVLDAAGALEVQHAPGAAGLVRYRALFAGGDVGGARYAPSASSVTEPVAVISPTSTTATASPSTVNAGSSITVAAAVVAPDGAGAPVTVGDVVFERSLDGGAFAPFATTAVDAEGRAAASYVAGAESSVAFRARYAGADVYAASLSSATAPVAVRQLVTLTKTWTATWSRTFFGSGAVRTDAEFRSFCIQGQYSSNNGNQRCAVGFDAADMRATLAGATMKKVEAFLYWDHWYGDSGTALIGTHNTTNAPSSWQALSGVVPRRVQKVLAEDAGAWIALPKGIGNELRDGTSRGLVLGPAPDTSQAWYGYARGADQASPPRIRIEYQVWR